MSYVTDAPPFGCIIIFPSPVQELEFLVGFHQLDHFFHLIVFLTYKSRILSLEFLVFIVAVLVNIKRILSKFGLHDKATILKPRFRVS